MASEWVACQKEKEASTALRATTGNEHRSFAPSTPASRSGFELVFVGNTNGASSTMSRKCVRAYVAKQAHARVRRERIVQHQRSNCQQSERAAGYLYEQLQSKNATLNRLKNVVLSPVGPKTLLSAAPIDPFSTAARHMPPFEYSLLLHYIERVVPLVQTTTYAVTSPEEYLHGINRDWIPLALTDPGLLNGILISACRSLHAFYGGRSPYLKAALRYKLTCIKSLNDDISKETIAPRDATIAKAIMLAGDEVAIGDFASGSHHINAALHMVALRGGPAMIATNHFLRTLVHHFSSQKRASAEAEMVFMNYHHFRT